MGLIKRWLVKRALKKASSKSDMEKIADAVLKDAMQELQQTGRTADKILKAKLLRQESSHALKKISELDEEFMEEEQEAPESLEDTLTNRLIEKFLSSSPPANKTNEFFDNYGEPIQQQPTAELPKANSPQGFTPEELKIIKAKFLK